MGYPIDSVQLTLPLVHEYFRALLFDIYFLLYKWRLWNDPTSALQMT